MPNVYHDILRHLRAVYDEDEARAVAFLVLEESFGVSRTDVYADKITSFSEQEHQKLQNILHRLVEKGEPVQYVIGRARFCGRDFRVTPATLIPRPETEELVDKLTSGHVDEQTSRQADEPLSILDVGTGSGCIAVSLKLAFPDAYVEAWDISPEALAVARENAQTLGADVSFRCEDALTASPEKRFRGGLLVSNPPYVCQREAQEMEPRVLEHEPHGALFVPDSDPLLFYRALCRIACDGEFAAVALETNRAYADDVATLFANAGFAHAEVLRDSFGNKRFVVAKADNNHFFYSL